MPDLGADSKLRPYHFMVRQDGSIYRVIKGSDGSEVTITNPTTAIQYAFDHLTSGRTYQEKVLLIGDFVMSLPVTWVSFLELELIGRVKQADGAEAQMFKTAAANVTAVDANKCHHISVHGGEWDGNNANNPGGGSNGFIDFQTCVDVDCRDMWVHDAKYGIIFQGSNNVRCHNIQGKGFTKMLLSFDAHPSGVDEAYNCVWTNCISEDAGINGFWMHGQPNFETFGCSITNCIAHGADFAGIYMDEKLWGYECVGNYCYDNGDSTTSGAGIWINGEQDGLPWFRAEWNTCIGNVCYQNRNDGIFLTKASEVLVANNVCAENRWNGLFCTAPHNCMIINNMCANNSIGLAGTWNGIDMISMTDPGAVLRPVHDNIISGNKCFDNQTVKTQQYGIQIRSTTTAYNNIIKDNDCRYNRAGQNQGISSCDLSNCYNNKGFRTKVGRYTGVHPTDSAEGMLQGMITVFTNAANATVARTIDSTGTYMTYTTSSNTNADTCGAKVAPFTERNLQPVFKCKFKHTGGTLDRVFLGWSSGTASNITTIASILSNLSGVGIYMDGQTSINYRLFTNNGAASTTNTDSVIAFDSAVHELQILMDNGSGVLFVLDDVLLTNAKITTGVPAATTDMGLYWAVQTQSASAAKVLDIWDVEVIQKD